MKKFQLFLVLSLLLLYSYAISSDAHKQERIVKEGTETEHIIFGFPGSEGTILYRKGYVLAHNNKKKVADWVSYHLTDEYLIKKVERTDDFRPDPDLPEGQRAELEDYR